MTGSVSETCQDAIKMVYLYGIHITVLLPQHGSLLELAHEGMESTDKHTHTHPSKNTALKIYSLHEGFSEAFFFSSNVVLPEKSAFNLNKIEYVSGLKQRVFHLK